MIKIILTAAVLAAAPLTVIAECSSQHQQVMSCADGTVWDAESKSCTKVTG